jgi:uncharacterized membrane protein YtjA (UPF0391 family)
MTNSVAGADYACIAGRVCRDMQPVIKAFEEQGRPNSCIQGEEVDLLYWALVFFIIAIVAGVLGFGGIAGAASSIAQILFFVFLVIFIVALFTDWRRRPPRG